MGLVKHPEVKCKPFDLFNPDPFKIGMVEFQLYPAFKNTCSLNNGLCDLTP